MTASVYMVDDEEDLVWSTAQSMRRERPDLAFEGFSDPAIALARIHQAPPNLLITDLRMPVMNGLDLLLAARALQPELPAVVITAYGGKDVLAAVRGSGVVEYLEKPFSFQSLAQRIDSLLARGSQGFSGAISLPLLPDLIQIYTLSFATGALRISRAEESGTIWFERGAMVHAVCGEARAEEAVYRLLRWQNGSFALDAGQSAPERSIELSWQEVLMEGCRLLDEDSRSHEGATSARGLSDLVRHVEWDESQLRAAPPQSLALGVDLAAGELVARSPGDAPSSGDWIPAVGGLLEVLARLLAPDGERGSIELLSDDVAIALAWNRAHAAAVVLADVVQERAGVARFRSQVARLSARKPWAPADQSR